VVVCGGAGVWVLYSMIIYCVYVIYRMPKDLLHPSQADEKRKHKLKRLIQSPNSFFMDVKCPGCFVITTIFSHAQVIDFVSVEEHKHVSAYVLGPLQ
jgi:hypothetical protein